MRPRSGSRIRTNANTHSIHSTRLIASTYRLNEEQLDLTSGHSLAPMKPRRQDFGVIHDQYVVRVEELRQIGKPAMPQRTGASIQDQKPTSVTPFERIARDQGFGQMEVEIGAPKLWLGSSGHEKSLSIWARNRQRHVVPPKSRHRFWRWNPSKGEAPAPGPTYRETCFALRQATIQSKARTPTDNEMASWSFGIVHAT